MGKKKSEKLTPLQKKQKKEEMKDIMKKLEQIKEETKDKIQKLKPVALVGTVEKKERKGSYKREREEEIEEVEMEEVPKKVNIFGVEKFEVDQALIKPKEDRKEKEQELSLEDQARKRLGQLNFDSFLERPLHKISTQIVSESQDDKPSPYPDIKLPTGFNKIDRTPEIAQFRNQLPILAKQQEIVQLINNNPVVLICGETGSGKSTQIPQFLFEKNYTSFGMIAVTQPRRLAAIALAQRVSEEMNTEVGSVIGYQVRHEKVNNEGTDIKFMTDGILLNEISSDLLLLKYSVVIIDEAHERKINSDLLVGLLSKLVEIRYRMSKQGKCNPLRLVIMSATMRVQDFNNKNLFPHLPPIIKIESRMFPVTTYFAKITPKDYVAQAVKKCVKIHKTLPQGDVLVFLTGKEQIIKMVKQLHVALEEDSYGEQRMISEDSQGDDSQMSEEIEYQKQNQYQPEIQHQQQTATSSYQILPLYSSLPMQQQRLIFTSSNKRRFIISTNIAETSLTIPKIRYVIDSGYEKYKHFDKIWRWYIGWGTKAMAEQRAGRAGRVAHGYCYRLYSTAVYSNTLKEFPDPEITKVPLENVILQLKAVGIQDVLRFPFPTPPERTKMISSINSLIELKAVEGEALSTLSLKDETKITDLGKILSFIPLEPIYGKLLLIGRSKGVPKYMLYLVLSLTVEVIIAHSFKAIIMQNQDLEGDSQQEKDTVKKISKTKEAQKNILRKNIQQKREKINEFKSKYNEYYSKGSDVFLNMNIIGTYFSEILKRRDEKGEEFNFDGVTKEICKRIGLVENSMREVFRNGEQIVEIYETMTGETLDYREYIMPKKQEVSKLLDGLLECYYGHVVHLEDKAKYKLSEDSFIYLHPSSYLYSKPPLFVSYIETFQTNRSYMRYPFVVNNFKFLAERMGKVNPIEYTIWDGKLHGVATGEYNTLVLPPFRVEVEERVKYYHIGRLFLEGKILKLEESQKQRWTGLRINTKIMEEKNKSDERVEKTVGILEKLGLESDRRFEEEIRGGSQFIYQILKLWVEQAKAKKMANVVHKHYLVKE